MADWSLIRSTLQSWVEDVTGLDCYWKKRPAGWWGTGSSPDDGWIELFIAGRATIGNDEIRREYDSGEATGEQLRTYQVGDRAFTLEIRVRTFVEDDDADALHYISLIRDSVDLPTKTAEVLDGANIAFSRILADNDFDEVIDGREVSVAQIDVRFNAASVVEDTKTTWIETVTDADLEMPKGSVVWTGDLEVG